MKQAMQDRDKRLSSRTPGLDVGSSTVQERYDGQAEMMKIRAEFNKNPTAKNKERYLEIQRQLGEVRFKK